MQVRCPSCQTLLNVTQRSEPVRVKCPKCAKLLQIPAAKPAARQPTPNQSRPQSTPHPANDPFGQIGGFPPATAPSAHSGTPPANAPAQPYSTAYQTPPGVRPPKKRSGIPGWVFIVAGVTLVGALTLCGLGLLLFSNDSGQGLAAADDPGLGRPPFTQSRSNSSAANSSGSTTDSAAAAVPSSTDVSEIKLPELGPVFQTFSSGVRLHQVRVLDGVSKPGRNMELHVYLPKAYGPDSQAADSVPCVLVAPAGTPLLHGSALGSGGYHDEVLPYAEAGMVTILYSIDGELPNGMDLDNQMVMTSFLPRAFKKFKDARGGVTNGRVALEFALQKLKGIDTDRICAAGHSSAATLALNLAAEEPRITHCAAFAASYNTERRLAEAVNDPGMQRLLPGIKDFIHGYSPINRTSELNCKLLIFHARDDGNVPFSDALQFTTKLKGQGKTLDFVQERQGGHYQPMIDKGIPTAINWLK